MTTRLHVHSWRDRGRDPNRSFLDFYCVLWDCRCGASAHTPILGEMMNWWWYAWLVLMIGPPVLFAVWVAYMILSGNLSGG